MKKMAQLLKCQTEALKEMIKKMYKKTPDNMKHRVNITEN